MIISLRFLVLVLFSRHAFTIVLELCDQLRGLDEELVKEFFLHGRCLGHQEPTEAHLRVPFLLLYLLHPSLEAHYLVSVAVQRQKQLIKFLTGGHAPVARLELLALRLCSFGIERAFAGADVVKVREELIVRVLQTRCVGDVRIEKLEILVDPSLPRCLEGMSDLAVLLVDHLRCFEFAVDCSHVLHPYVHLDCGDTKIMSLFLLQRIFEVLVIKARILKNRVNTQDTNSWL